MNLLSKLKYLLWLLAGSLILVAPAYAVSPTAATKSNEVKTRTQLQVKACQAKQQVVTTRMENLLRLSGTMLDVFDGIQTRVEEFYQNRVIKNGGSVSNYNDLAKDIKVKRDAVQTALGTAKIDSGKFSCDQDPKTSLVTFRKDMQAVKSALKDFRFSIKNFIVAVKTASKVVPTAVPTGGLEK